MSAFRIILFFFTISFVVSEQCLPSPAPNAECVNVSNYDHFVNLLMAKSPESLVLCPFNVKANGRIAEMIHPKTVQCQIKGKCTIDGGNQIVRLSKNANVLLQGFVFTHASMWVIHILQVNQVQAICDCQFSKNSIQKDHERGTCLRLDYHSKTLVKNCIFEENYVNGKGGAIFSWGQAKLVGNSFKGHTSVHSATALGFHSKSETYFEGNTFENNGENMIELFDGAKFNDAGGNVGFDNTGCNGIMKLNGGCISFNAKKPSENYGPLPTQPIEHPIQSNSTLPSPPTSIQPVKVVHTGTQVPGQCHNDVSPNTACIPVDDWNALKNTILTNTEEKFIFFCPFNITKENHEDPIIFSATETQSIVCVDPHSCRISGGGSYFIIGDPLLHQKSHNIFFQGFILEGSTKNALLVSYGTFGTQTLCFNHFLRNVSPLGFPSKGVAIRANFHTTVIIRSCKFEENTSNKHGASIYTMGKIYVQDSVFIGNDGPGSAITVGSVGYASIQDNIFENNSNPLFFQKENTFEDLGGNLGINNTGCHGFYHIKEKECFAFAITSAPTESPTIGTPMNVEGYFTYDLDDLKYGPSNWGSIKEDTIEKKRWLELKKFMPNQDLRNECNGGTSASWKQQSPIDICEDSVVDECYEFHQIRGIGGDLNILSNTGKHEAQILPNKLRIKYATRPEGLTIEKGEKDSESYKSTPQPPHADFPHYWHFYVQANHVDIKIPSEHTKCGKQYAAELTIWHLHPQPEYTHRNGQDVLAISILVELGQWNWYFHVAMIAFRNAFLSDAQSCCSKRNSDPELQKIVPESFCKDYGRRLSEHFDDDDDERELSNRNLKVGNGWSPYHNDIMKSIYFSAYHGSLTEPPCSTMVAWRIISEPMTIHTAQLLAMEHLLSEHRDKDTCQRTSVDSKGSTSRPVQEIVKMDKDHGLYECKRTNFVSDKEKLYMREITGDPHWCC